MRPLTEIRAKPAIPVAGEPMVRRIVKWLAANQVTDVAVNLHHLPETIASALGDGSDLSVHVRYSWEQPQVLGTAGGPRRALSVIGAPTFLVVNGDTLTDFDLEALSEVHETSGALVTLALVPNRSPKRYGGVRLDRSGRVVRFEPPGVSTDTFHFVGVQMVRAEVFSALAEDQPASSIGGVYDRLMATNPDAVRGFPAEATFFDVGTIVDYWTTSWSFAETGELSQRRSAVIHPSARVSRSILWDDVEVEAHCVIDECVLTDGVHVPRGTDFRRTILMRGLDGGLRTSPLPL